MSEPLSMLQQMFHQKKISRRQFVTQLTALGVSTALIPSFMTGKALAAGPKKGGHFRMGMAGGSTTDSLDAAVLAAQIDTSTSYAARNNLVEVDYKGQAIPELAESWEPEPGAAKWIFNLRKDVTFHNGKTMDSQDVAYSIGYHTADSSKSGAKGLVDQIKDIQTDGKHRVIFTLKSGNADFPFVLNDYHLVIVPDGTRGQEWEKCIGTGGYILESWEPGVRAILKRNPDFFKAGRAHFDSIEILHIADASSRTNALRTGQVDYMNRVDVKTVHLFKRTKGVNILRVNGGYHYTMPMHTDVAPYSNNDLRLALKYACDREKLVDKFLRGYGSPANDQPIPPFNKYHAKDIPQRAYDPDKAAYHFKKAGMKDEAITLFTSEEAGFIDVATLYAESARKAGITIKLQKEPADGYWSNVWLKQPFCNCYWGARPTADMMFSVAYSGDAKWNDTHFKHAKFDQLLLAARSELDETKRQAMYTECQQIVRDEGGSVIPFFKDYVEACSDKVAQANLSGLWETDSYKAIERWWFA